MKKNLNLILVLIGLPFLQACINSTSEATILKDGSGTLVTYIDMARVFEYYDKLGIDLRDSALAGLMTDSVIYFKNNMKEFRSLSTDEMEVYENTIWQKRADMGKRILNVTITSKFSKITQLPIAIEFMKDEFDEKVVTGKDQGEPVVDKEIDLLKHRQKDGMSYNVKIGLIEYAYDEKRDTRSNAAKDMSQSFDQYKMMSGGIPVKMIFNLPHPAKSITGKAKTEISPNKKKITISYDMLEALVNPSIQSYRIVY